MRALAGRFDHVDVVVSASIATGTNVRLMLNLHGLGLDDGSDTSSIH